MAELTAAEKKWIKQVNALVAKCPSKRLGFYTIGDNYIGLYDRVELNKLPDEGGDLVLIIQREGINFDDHLYFPENVEGVCG